MVDSPALYLPSFSPHSWMHLRTWDLSVICCLGTDFLLYFLVPWSQGLCLPSVRGLLRNGQESWLERRPGLHILASLLECQGLGCGAIQRGVLAPQRKGTLA